MREGRWPLVVANLDCGMACKEPSNPRAFSLGAVAVSRIVGIALMDPRIGAAHAKPFTLLIKLLMFLRIFVTFDLWQAPGRT